MEAFEKIRERFEFSLPDDYLKFWNAGILVSDKVAGLWMSRYWWLTPDKIADIDQYQWPIGIILIFGQNRLSNGDILYLFCDVAAAGIDAGYHLRPADEAAGAEQLAQCFRSVNQQQARDVERAGDTILYSLNR